MLWLKSKLFCERLLERRVKLFEVLCGFSGGTTVVEADEELEMVREME